MHDSILIDDSDIEPPPAKEGYPPDNDWEAEYNEWLDAIQLREQWRRYADLVHEFD